MGEKAFHRRGLRAHLASVGEDALDTVELLPGQQIIERYRPVVEAADGSIQRIRLQP
jgi:hypothetical protein